MTEQTNLIKQHGVTNEINALALDLAQRLSTPPHILLSWERWHQSGHQSPACRSEALSGIC